MFIEAKLKNFRQHKDLTVNFENGIVALRGANEKGKTTILEAIMYAMGGARTLREPLPEVVTWGEKESSLKVWLTFQVNGVGYHVIRSKSGAEIRSGEGFEKIEATGQDEVTRYIETLLGCSIKVAGQLMLANQQKVRGTLEEDGAAVKLIEQLADFQLIDRVVALVQKHRPCGTTVPVESRIQTLEEQLAEPVQDDTGPALQILAETQQCLDAEGKVYSDAKATYDMLQEPAKAAQQRLDREAAGVAAAAAAQKRLEAAEATLAGIKPVPGPSDERVAELRKQVEDAGRWRRAAGAKKLLEAAPEPMWEGPFVDLQAAHNAARIKHTDLTRAIAEHAGNVRALTAQKITGTACGLCGKDLTAVPEVVKKNEELDRQIEEQQALQQQATLSLRDTEAEVASYQEVINAGSRADSVFHQCAEFVKLDRNFTPAKWEWIGPDTSQPVVDASDTLQQATQQQQAYQRDLGRQQQAKAAVDAAKAVLAEAEKERDAAAAAVGEAHRELEESANATQQLCAAEQAYRAADEAVKLAERGVAEAQRMLEMRLQNRRLIEDHLTKARKELEGMNFNNDLVNALRKARPSIVEELWNIVGTTVSDTFSRIRGTPSVFMRVDDSFTVDGRGIKGLSGSTLDSLGLAVRIGLTKTFLPNTRVLALDEPAAACDPDRETNMLGVVAAADFDQVILVTHSDLADAFASQVVRL